MRSRSLNLLLVSSEAVPFAKTGGLGDVAGSLGRVLHKSGVKVSIILPLYRGIREKFRVRPLPLSFSVTLGGNTEKGRVWKSHAKEAGYDAYFIEHDGYFDRAGLYGEGSGDYPDNVSRFTFFSRAVLEAADGLNLRPNIVHSNDWQSALVPLYAKTLYRTRFPHLSSVYTIHNLGYQGSFWHLDMPILSLGWELFNIDALEYYGNINFMKGGIVFADRVTTVSPTYAREILTEEQGFGLHGVLKTRGKELSGILNGIDTAYWDPSSDSHIAARYDLENKNGKNKCKRALQRELGLLISAKPPLIGMVTRFAPQKGLDLLIRTAPALLKNSKAQIAVLGEGDQEVELAMLRLARDWPGRVHVRTGFREDLAHRIYAGSDIFLMPSKYEPCGLSQMIAMRYGTIPVARRTGGLADTITNRGKGRSGFLFSGYAPRFLLDALYRAMDQFIRPAIWDTLMTNAMSRDFSWEVSARQYMRLYEDILQL